MGRSSPLCRRHRISRTLRRVSASLAVFSGIVSTVSAADPAAEIRPAIERGLELVKRAAQSWPTNRECFSCHHQTLPAFAVVEAARVGFATDADWLKTQADITLAHFRQKRDSLSRGGHIGGGAFTVVYGLWALDLDHRPPDDTTEAMVAYLLKTQGAVRPEGGDDPVANPPAAAWAASCRRPPLQISPVAATVLALRGMQVYATEKQHPRLAEARERAERWLVDAPLETQEDRVWRLWGLHEFGDAAETVQAVRKVILDGQHDDGGWPQQPGLPSDAYSTGQTLYVLRLTGSPVDDPAIQRAAAYLLRTQHPDGSWLVETRAKPVQTFFENGDPHGKHQFLSVAATAWATVGLCGVMMKDEG